MATSILTKELFIGQLYSEGDMNDLVKPGLFFLGSSNDLSNLPETYAAWSACVVLRYGNSDVQQIIFPNGLTSNNNMYTRRKLNNVWKGWYKVPLTLINSGG